MKGIAKVSVCALKLRYGSWSPFPQLAASSTVSGPGVLTAGVHSALSFPIVVFAL